MRRIFFTWRGITVWSYPAMLYIGLVVGIMSGNAIANADGLDARAVFIASCLLIVPSLAGARLLHVAINWNFYRDNPSMIWDTNQGGQAQYGGILLAVPLSIPLLYLLGVPFGKFWDVGSFTIMIGMVFTRFGCLMNGCCSGRPSNAWGTMNLPNRKGVWEKRIPNQLLEAGWAAMILVCTFTLRGRLPFDGALFVFTCAGYASGRLLFESLRESNAVRRGFTVHHAISVLIIALSLAALTVRSSL